MNLLNLDQDAFCKVIEQLQPIHPEQLIDLLEINREFTERILQCVDSIDLSSGEPLTMKSGLPSQHTQPGKVEELTEKLALKLFNPSDLVAITTRPYDADEEDSDVTLYPDKYRKIISVFPHLREYRALFQPYEELDKDPRQFDDLEFLIRDVRARWLFFLNIDEWNSQLIDTILDGLRSRVEKYGSEFTFVYETDKYDFSFLDGTLILNLHSQIPPEEKRNLAKIMNTLSSTIHSLGSNDSETLSEVLKMSIMRHVKNVIVFGTSQSNEEGESLEFWNTFKIEHLYPYFNRLTDIEFRVGIEFIDFPAQLPHGYMSSLLGRGNQNPQLSFLNITKFEIPIPLSGTIIRILKRLFPNVPRFYHIEEYQLASQLYYLEDSLAMQYLNLDNIAIKIKSIE